MKGACEDSQLPHIKDCKSAKVMWDTLKTVHVTNQARINVHYYFEDLYTRKDVDGTSMADHIAAMLNIKQQINDAGESLDDIHVARAMVLSLPKTQSWDIIKIQLFDLEPAKLTIDMVSTKLQSEANHPTHEKGASNSALYVQKKDTHKHKKGSGKGPYAICHDEGHSGHKAKECPHDYKDRDKAKAESQPQSTNFTVSNLQDLGTHEIGQVFIAIGGIPDTNDILLDSVATSHMFCEHHLFSSYTSSTENETMSVGDKCALVVAGQGSITFKNQLMNGVRTVVLHGALYVPQLTTNLISLGRYSVMVLRSTV
jgi:hypothetical protein